MTLTSAIYPLQRRLIDAAVMFIVLFVSLLLLLYVALEEGRRTFENFQGDKLAAQARIVQNAMETFLSSGLPLRQFVGFSTLTDQILTSDDSISSITVYDTSWQPVFRAGARDVPLLPQADNVSSDGIDRRSNAEYYQAVVPLRNKFETVGSIAVTMPSQAITERVESSFKPIVLLAGIGSTLFALFIAIAGPALQRRRTPWAQIAYTITFVAVAAGVIVTLVGLYTYGAQAKTRAIANSLGQRLQDLVAFNINIDEIDGLDQTFARQLDLNPDISAVALTINNEVIIHTDASQVGRPWSGTSSTHYQYVVDLTAEDSVRNVAIAVELPRQVILWQVIRSVKNFAALFVSSAFLASLFFQLGGSVRRSAVSEVPTKAAAPAVNSKVAERALDFVKPVFFLGVLCEHLTYAFLPQFVQRIALEAGVPSVMASAPFMGFYLFFALALIPAGHWAQRIGPRPLMYAGPLLIGLGLALLTVADSFWLVFGARCLSGIGSGILFIGVQSYILIMAPPDKKTQGAGIIVYGFQGGMISGMAVGSLLVTSIGTNGVFWLSTVIAGLTALYALIVLPGSAHSQRAVSAPVRMGRSIVQALRNGDFLNTILTIGVPAKAILTGVITFALPLLLTQSDYTQADIGQIVMVYALGVVFASRQASRMVDRQGNSRGVLFNGTLFSGIGLAMVMIGGLFSANAFGPLVLVLGVALVGVAHGLINAPVVTRVADSPLAARMGQSAATATYRFVERGGHIAGPIIVGQLFVWFGQDWSVIGLIALVTIGLGIVFQVMADRRKPSPIASSSAR